MQVREPYLIFREEKGGVNPIRGIWFHNGEERSAIAALLDRVAKSLAHMAAGLEKQHVPSSAEDPPRSSSSQRKHAQHPNHPPSSSVVDEGAAAAALLSPLTLCSEATSTASQSTASTTTHTRQNSSSLSSTSHLDHNLVLDKKSLQLSLMSLIQDERFLDLIHAQYLKVAHARAKNKDVVKK
eukprot:2883284-Ditylum_brightwellii.AAC.1